ncbi:HET-domain-containing protein [Lophiostoma macrostomum CBS 122681]|uniref:HET-domain-containing protein n=1 Tax=Lophiostoma macrostomum CBS 122681 TaxID=1314788 RepID=A0A6A6SYY4_9PLEO|nr:HET-domain-containing protein [Lophiostoma macrostomum CBS 122681]
MAEPTVALSSEPTSRAQISTLHLSDVLGQRSFSYHELVHDEFRLLRILPRKMTTIKCEILHASLDDPPDYIALSYTWGDPQDTRRIILDGHTLSVSSSLHGALEALRQTKETTLVWADALCINQQDRSERDKQVRRMGSIYTAATSVAIWLGPEADNSPAAIQLLRELELSADSPATIPDMISSRVGGDEIPATVALFDRAYWKRLWVVQEVLNAQKIRVYCGSTITDWQTYVTAHQVFRGAENFTNYHFPAGQKVGKHVAVSQDGLSYSEVLAHRGPGSFSDLRSHVMLEEGSLLAVLLVCRGKLASDPRDKVYGILGILPEVIQEEFPVDYSLSTKEVYTNVVDYLLCTTNRLDIICEAIHHPFHPVSASGLPSWVPDWSHIPKTTALGSRYRFEASGDTNAQYKFKDVLRNKLEISAIPLDTVYLHGMAVGTQNNLADYLMAFWHWRELVLANENTEDRRDGPISNIAKRDAFCRTICLDQIPSQRENDWTSVVLHIFSNLLHSRYPHLRQDSELQSYGNSHVGIEPDACLSILQRYIGARMMGHCFCVTEGGLYGMGTGFSTRDDLIVVPLGCSTPILLRPDGYQGEYRFVGDVYVDGYMRGEAVEEWKEGKRQLKTFVMH